MGVPTLSLLGEHGDHQLDSHGNAQQNSPLRGVARCIPARHRTQQPAQMVPQQSARLEKPAARPDSRTSVTACMDEDVPPGSTYPNPQDASSTQESVSTDSWDRERGKSSTGGGKKKNYQRYPKPPYSYLAMIAMVIQRSPEKKLTLSEVRLFLSVLNNRKHSQYASCIRGFT